MSLFFRSSFLLLYISALHWGDCGRNTAYGGNDFFDLCSWYLQVYVLWNFDESDEISKKELLGIIICTIIYTAVSYIGKWFDRNSYVTLGFAAYIVCVYICVYLVYKCRRRIDDKILNSDLILFKTRTDNK